MEDLRYPAGKFTPPAASTAADRNAQIEGIAGAPAGFRQAIQELPEGGLDKPYRPGGWTARQVVHHVADSHMNSYVRFRLALTEETPTIKPYEESRWAELEDARSAPAEISLQLLDALHDRWVRLLRSLSDRDFQRKLRHPEMGEITLEYMLALYDWHCRHHTAHIRLIK
ncbi:MAG: putative metal-dependent hydrolase [Acidimicrobiia bacterium]|nr:putative metal-dependent hydrolase [Acidimicrobiia bacterium]